MTCQWPEGCTRQVPASPRGQQRRYCGKSGHTARRAYSVRQRQQQAGDADVHAQLAAARAENARLRRELADALSELVRVDRVARAALADARDALAEQSSEGPLLYAVPDPSPDHRRYA